MRVWTVPLQYIWAAPATVVGLAVAALAAFRGRVRVVDGVVEAHSPFLRWALTHLVPVPRGVAAMTLGHVVVGRDAAALEVTRAHERVHVRQYERWGPLFVPAYLAASVWAWATGRHVYYDNVFEREAFRAEASMNAGQPDSDSGPVARPVITSAARRR